MKIPATTGRLAIDLETALSGLAKLIKAFKFYPAEHPTLSTTAEESCQAFQPLLQQHPPRSYHISKDGFSLDATLLAPDSRNLKELAQILLDHQVQQLRFLPELDRHELLIFAEQLALPAGQLFQLGGLSQQLNNSGIRAIRINETAPQKAQRKSAAESLHPEEPGVEPQLSAPAELSPAALATMRDLLEQLKEPLADDQYLQTLQQLVPLAPQFFEQTGIAGQLSVLNLLEAQRQDPHRSRTQNEAAAIAAGQLLSGRVIQQLVNAVAAQDLKGSQRRALARLLAGLQLKAAAPLFKRLNAERDAILRRRYSSILAQLGTVSFELLETALNDPRWYVVRNAVTVLGETRTAEALPLLKQALSHPELRVRRAVIRALGAIGGSQVIPLLVQLSQDSQPALHQPAIMALGALNLPEALVPLNDILKKADFWGKHTLLKLEVIKAMADTRSPKAIIPLLKLARRRNLLRRKNLERLRAEAILSLGQLGNKKLLPLIERLPSSNKGPVSRALQQTTAQLTKID